MDTWQPSTLTWSFSRRTHFDSCRRHYFYHRFWGQDPKLRWRLFEMRNLTTLLMLRGQVVHTVIADALNSIRIGIAIDAATAKKNITQVIRERYAESAKRLWHIDNRPKDRKASDITSLIEHYYAFPNTSERARDAQRTAWLCMTNLIESDFWREIAASDAASWKEIENDAFQSFDLDGIQVYARIDFAHASGAPTIIDWKTGSPSAADRTQLAVYALYAFSKWGWDPREARLAAVYLQPDLRVDAFTPTEGDIEAAKDEVRTSFGRMMELEPAFGPAKIEDFPLTDELRNCAWCRFRGVCDGARRPDLPAP